MVNNINFLHQQKKQLEHRDKTDKKSFIFILGVLVLILSVYGGVYLLGANFQSELDAVNQEINTKKNQIRAEAQNETNYLEFYDKIKKLTELLGLRSHGTQSLVDTYTYFTTPDTAIISSLYDYYTENLEMTLSSNSIFSLQNLLTLIQDPDFRAEYHSVELLNLSRDITGTYRLKINLAL